MATACGAPAGAHAQAQARPHNPPPAAPDLRSALLDNSADLGPVAPTDQASVDLQLKARTTLVDRAESIYDPSSPNYLHFTTPEQLAAGAGADPAAVARATRELQAQGLQVSWEQGSSALNVTGTAATVDRVFGVDVHHYRARSGQEFTASRALPLLPAGLDPVVIGADPISTYNNRHTAAVPPGGLKPAITWNAYDTKALLDAGIDGKGETVSIYALGDGFSQAGLDDWTSKMGLPPVKPVIKSGPPGAKEGLELMMDIEAVHELAPGAQIFVYTDSPDVVLHTVATAQAFYNKMIQDNPGGIWSMSWGGCELGDSPAELKAFADFYAKAAAAGISVFHSSGDSGAYECMSMDWGAPPSDKSLAVPAESAMPVGVTAVGGTRLSVRQDGSYYDEVVWSEPLTTQGGGGGLSHAWQQPDWQRGPGVDSNQFNPNKMRMVPDVAADADPVSGLAIEAGGDMMNGGGTSLAAPIWAGITALMNQYLKQKGLKPVGFLNPALYAIAAGKPPVPAFHDVKLGNNLHYPATPGYDMATGLGTPDAANLARDLEQFQRNGGKI